MKSKKIKIYFSQDVIDDVSANKSAFTVTATEEKYVNGPLQTVTYPVIAVSGPQALLATKTVPINTGTHDNTIFDTNYQGVTIAYDAI